MQEKLKQNRLRIVSPAAYSYFLFGQDHHSSNEEMNHSPCQIANGYEVTFLAQCYCHAVFFRVLLRGVGAGSSGVLMLSFNGEQSSM